MHHKQRYGYLFAALFLVGCIALGGWVWIKFSHSLQQSNQTVTLLNTHNSSTPTSRPYFNIRVGAHLLIPAIGVDAPVEPVGVTSGVLNVPHENQWTGVGWYENGPVPGQAGSAVIDGHLDRPGGLPAVFWKLNQLHVGDTVMVVDTQGKSLNFRVVGVQAYAPSAAPLNKIYGDTSGTYLNLITCAGQWIPSQHQTTQRLVVYTKMIS
jgi:LPXTG-site transpeptidase (sortase) family protein